jgi:hypothetical protein
VAAQRAATARAWPAIDHRQGRGPPGPTECKARQRWGTACKIKTMLRQFYGLRDADFLRLKLYALHEPKHKLVGCSIISHAALDRARGGNTGRNGWAASCCKLTIWGRLRFSLPTATGNSLVAPGERYRGRGGWRRRKHCNYNKLRDQPKVACQCPHLSEADSFEDSVRFRKGEMLPPAHCQQSRRASKSICL